MYYGFLLLLRTAAHLSVGSESYKNVQVIYSTHHILSTSCTMINTFPPLCSGGNFADAVFRFNANISYSGVLHAVTQDVSCPRLLLMFFFSSHLLWPRLITVIHSSPSSSTSLCLFSPQGLFSENKEKLINNAILALLSQEAELPALNAELESHFQAIRRLVASKAGFQAFTQLPK